MIDGLVIRAEQPDDHTAIYNLTKSAFETMPFSDGREPEVIDNLRSQDALSISLVGELDGELAAHVAFSEVLIENKSCRWYGLGPVSVQPSLQRKGIGSALIHDGLGKLKSMGAMGCVLLGDPSYYQRFGFETDPRLSYGENLEDYFQRLAFCGDVPKGAVKFHPAFGE